MHLNEHKDPYVLIVDDEPPFLRLLEKVVAEVGYGTRTAMNGEEAVAVIANARPALVFLDLRLGPRVMDGIETLTKIHAQFGYVPVILITGYGDIKHAVKAMKLGALDFLEKPLDVDEIRQVLREVLLSTAVEQAATGQQLIPFGGITPAPGPFQAVLELMTISADSSAPLLITGESGTGKELAAAFIHQKSPFANGPLIKINCAAIPGNLLESEMFGIEKGAFTGAHRSKPGKFEMADGGTLLLDELGEMDVALQAKLLRVIQEKEVERLGGLHPHKVDVRIIATTNRDLKQSIQEGTFRSDLFYRINVFEIVLPPLRERPNDILPLTRHFVAQFASETPPRLSSEIEHALISYDWPGNIRELRNALERAVILARGGVIHPEHLPPTIKVSDRPSCAFAKSPLPFPAVGGSLQEMERDLIDKTLRLCKGNRTRTAEKLGMSRRALQYKIKRYGLVN